MPKCILRGPEDRKEGERPKGERQEGGRILEVTVMVKTRGDQRKSNYSQKSRRP
jgi:hypothetical protein